jgi:hypothetical protein
MNKQQLTQVQTLIEIYKKLNLPELLVKAYPNQTRLDNLQISKLTISEFNSLTNKVFIQLEKELNSENTKVLPFTFSSPELGQSNLESIIGNFNSYVQNMNFPNAENSLLWLAQYQLQNGFFDKSKVKYHSEELLNLKKTNDEFHLLNENYIQLKDQYNKLLTDINFTKNDITDLYEQKQKEFQQLSSFLQNANNNNNDIQKCLNTSLESSTKINSNLQQTEKDKINIEITSKEISKTYSQFKSDYQNLLTELKQTEYDYSELYRSFIEKLNFVDEKHSYFIDRNNYLDNLIGREVGASLFETFKQRKSELENPIKWWRLAVVAMSIIIFIVILAIFTNLFGYFGPFYTKLNWENVIVNTLKASPFFFLLYYAIAQYNKERNFQEEYAFKSATALTIKAYSDILKDDKNKDELFLKAVFGIYRSPLSQSNKNENEVNTAIDMIADLSKTFKDIVKKN